MWWATFLSSHHSLSSSVRRAPSIFHTSDSKLYTITKTNPIWLGLLFPHPSYKNSSAGFQADAFAIRERSPQNNKFLQNFCCCLDQDCHSWVFHHHPLSIILPGNGQVNDRQVCILAHYSSIIICYYNMTSLMKQLVQSLGRKRLVPNDD